MSTASSNRVMRMHFQACAHASELWIHDCSDIALFHLTTVALLAKAKAVDLLTLP